ncbi:MAG: DUF6702 family protein [Longimicrobiales bacterium]
MKRTLLAVLLLLLAGSAPLLAGRSRHELGQSYIFLRVYADSIEVRVEITVDDLNRVLGVGWSSDAGVTADQLAVHLDSVMAYVRPRLAIAAGGRGLPLRFVRHDVRDQIIADYAMLHFMIDDLAELPPVLEVEYPVFFEIDTKHRNLLVIEHNWRTTTFNQESNIAAIFSPSAPRQTVDLSRSTVMNGFLGFIRLGIWHIWIGIDHVLFLLALIFPSVLRRRDGRWEAVPSFRPALMNMIAIVTCFTIAHSITLSMAALGVVRLPARPIEAIIALSIGAAALYNIYRPFDVREWALAFAFGLFHGFGFANVLAELQLEPTFLVLSLLGFNLGVEIGQVAIIGIAFPLLYLLRTTRFYLPAMRYGSAFLIAIALFWFVERVSGLPLTQYAMRAPFYVYRRFVIGV